MPPRLLVFDLDNTVIHSRIDFASIRRDLVDLIRRAGAAAPADQLTRLSIGQIIEVGAALDATIGQQAWQIVLAYEKVGMEAATVEECAHDTLTLLRSEGFRLAVLTNNARQATMAALEKFGLHRHFDLVLTRDDVAMKPSPAGILKAREYFQERLGGQAMIGDSWLDGMAAHQASAPFIAFRPRPGVLSERGIPVWAVVERLDEIPPLVAGPWPSEAASGAYLPAPR